MFKEEFLHHIWKFQLFNSNQLTTTSNKLVEVIHQGSYNVHGGPDFTQAKVKIDGTLWVGNVEIHIHSNDWNAHKHQHDEAYNTVILHVVFDESPVIVKNQKGEELETITLNGRISKNQIQIFHQLEHSKLAIPCANVFQPISAIDWLNFQENLILERLQNKLNQVVAKNSLQNDFTVFYSLLFRAFGQKVNAEPFLQLWNNLDFTIISKNRHDFLKIQALLFGMAGFLENEATAYDVVHPKLKQEFNFLAHKYNLTPLQASSFKYGRLRPGSFPQERIAQLAFLLFKFAPNEFMHLKFEEWHNLNIVFSETEFEYWQKHYALGKPYKKPKKSVLTKAFVNHLGINVLAPYYYFKYLESQNESWFDSLFELLQMIPAEKINGLDIFYNLGFQLKTSLDSQSLLQLKLNYCDKKQCLNCKFGNQIIKKV